MKTIKTLLAVAGCLTLLALSTNNVAAQGRRNGGAGGGGNFDPAAARQQQMDRIKTAMDVTDDSEWKVLEAAIGKVLDARQELGNGGRGGGFGGGGAAGGGRRNRGGNNADAAAGGNNNGGNANAGGGRRGGGTPNPDAEALQAAIDAKAPTDEIKSKLAKLRDSTKAKETKLASAQDDLKKLLQARQEAVAVLFGLLK